MENPITATQSQLAAAFTEWERRHRDEPDRFQSENERLAQNAETIGDLQAAYLTQILTEQAAA
ncbi:hypothetical protein KB206_10715 [Microvirga sp. STS02]|uniref:hypothetical protein n=1 Tax=Hymenobacter negativus TaxID=2795026 RepID=UPI0018DE3B70|nr:MULTISPECIES: hypothetical protein [Bacteria]MBH8569358.1 hypothetical protein [Hymenobacter negativus]MBR7209092.1 hypothetical protein [Microvirga sp. STS02]